MTHKGDVKQEEKRAGEEGAAEKLTDFSILTFDHLSYGLSVNVLTP